ncbi:phosphotransferase [Frankia sp. Cpl3]|nr:phosphotransferase [Frankia sp. Cpl3]
MGDLRRVEILGDVVVRPRMPWTSTVHDLLRFLVAEGLPVPNPVGLDDRTERVQIVPGDAGQRAWPHQVHVDGVRSAGRLLRRVHDVAAAWTPPPDAVWSVPFEPSEVICHGDPQPANMAWVNGAAVGLFDWDAARPAPRISDVVYALEWLAPFERDPVELARRGFETAPDRRARITAFLDGYGWDEPFDVIAAVLTRQQQAIDEVMHLGAAGYEPQATWVEDGWPDRWLTKLDVTRSLSSEV